MMQREWQALGHPPPVNTNDRARKSFTTCLPEPRAVGGVTAQVAAQVEALIAHLEGELTRGELQSALGLEHREHFRIAYLSPALDAGLIEMTRPDKPNSRLQRYRLTEAARALRARRLAP
jgi:ATP-dependent DNA helicase RecG